MSNVSVRFAESAVADLEAIKEWYADQGVPDLGDRIVGGVFERLREHPDMGRVVPEFGESFLRELIHRPFRIVYHRGSKLVRVIRVWRSERLLVLPD